MSKKPAPAPKSSAPTLADLRKEIDRIDEEMHRLLMERGEIISTLISVKKTQEVGSAFRPAREADMMRRLVERHKGMLPLDTLAKPVTAKCWKAGLQPVRIDRRPGPKTAPPSVQVDCVLRASPQP